MYAYIKGLLVRATPSFAVVETAETVGYKIFIPTGVFGALPPVHTPVTLYTSFVIRENSQALFGFLDETERDLFELLLEVSGIGPKIALAIVGHLTPHALKMSLAKGDVPTLCKIPGIGKKGAERLILELKDKVHAILPPDPLDHAVKFPADPKVQTVTDAMSALVNLGYTQQIAQKALKKTMDKEPELSDLASLIRESLKHV